MSPEAARDWIAGLEILGMRFGLERMTALLAALGDPQDAAPALHVVGTNGKSSTTRLAAAALSGRGAAVGAYLSPHISGWAERFQIDGEPVGEDRFAAAVGAVRAAAEGLSLPAGDAVTQFEALTAAAFWTFREAGVGAAVVEAGLGGRYDATNVLRPHAAVALTNVALEHTELLGDTEAAIAAEKLAVCVDGSDRLVVGRLGPEAALAVDAECGRRGLRPLRYGAGLRARQADGGVEVVTPRAVYARLPLTLRGGFQRDNLAVAVAGAELVAGEALDRDVLATAVGRLRMPGRLEVLSGTPPVVLDGAHNPAGMAALVAALPPVTRGRRPVVAVLSVLDDKDAGAMVAALARGADAMVATRSAHARAVAPEALAALGAGAGLAARAVPDPRAALATARDLAGTDGMVIVTGSLYLLADLRGSAIREGQETPAMLARARKGTDPTEANSAP